ncbi:MAG: NADH-quinone oxidoreductase subunit N [Thermodesulfobacteriota bacterium]|jgi:NADH-quinone oxidoreductase subunit N|nr:MAG: NADH-quinone oxidoreductase subunit N [Thermodesulfobacteriota bacterium]
MTIPDVNWTSIGTELILISTAVLVIFFDLVVKDKKKDSLGYLTVLGMLGALVFAMTDKEGTAIAFGGMITNDSFTQFLTVLIVGVAIIVTLMSMQSLREGSMDVGGYHTLVLLATVGMLLMVKGLDLIIIFLGLETLSIAIYVLAGYRKGAEQSAEAAFKYFLLGAFAAAFLLYGIALIYGATGTTRIEGIAQYIALKNLGTNPLLLLGVGLLLVGLGFKLALVPFHSWTPDVYEGAPTAITAFMAVGVKAAAFAAFVRIFGGALPLIAFQWKDVLWMLAVITMTVGNVVALSQTNIKRMLAYSSIAHAGYILVGIIAGGSVGWSAVLYYLGAYAFMNLGAFGIVVFYGYKQEANVEIADYAGLGFRYPFLGAAMAIFLFSLAGIPPLAGFMGKFYIFSAAIKSGYIWLTIIGVMNSLVSVFYYFRVTVIMYMKEPIKEVVLNYSLPITIVLIIALVGTIQMGIAPNFYLERALDSIKWLIG